MSRTEEIIREIELETKDGECFTVSNAFGFNDECISQLAEAIESEYVLRSEAYSDLRSINNIPVANFIKGPKGMLDRIVKNVDKLLAKYQPSKGEGDGKLG